MAPPYAQAKENGYITSITNERSLGGLFGGKSREISEGAAKIIREMNKHGESVHLDDLPEIEARARGQERNN